MQTSNGLSFELSSTTSSDILKVDTLIKKL
jgi:hypothetical protein